MTFPQAVHKADSSFHRLPSASPDLLFRCGIWQGNAPDGSSRLPRYDPREGLYRRTTHSGTTIRIDPPTDRIFTEMGDCAGRAEQRALGNSGDFACLRILSVQGVGITAMVRIAPTMDDANRLRQILGYERLVLY
jgi:hypothetical protein